MKKNPQAFTASGLPPSPEEYRIFRGQPEAVLIRYSLVKRCMAVIMPLSALAAVFNVTLGLVFPLICGGTGFLLLRKKYGVKGALVPLFCSLAGFLAGLLALSPLFSHVLALKEVYGGI
jgi:hypothetical protein